MNKSQTINSTIWQGPALESKYGKPESLGKVLMSSMAQDLSGVAQICHDDDRVWTNEMMLQMSTRCALHFLGLGLREGDVISLATDNQTTLPPIIVAAFTIGLPVNGVYSVYTKSDFLHMFSITEPKLVICCANNFEVVSSVIRELRLDSLLYVTGDVVDPDVKPATDLLAAHQEEDQFK